MAQFGTTFLTRWTLLVHTHAWYGKLYSLKMLPMLIGPICSQPPRQGRIQDGDMGELNNEDVDLQ